MAVIQGSWGGFVLLRLSFDTKVFGELQSVTSTFDFMSNMPAKSNNGVPILEVTKFTSIGDRHGQLYTCDKAVVAILSEQ